jgi:hypothetical protein
VDLGNLAQWAGAGASTAAVIVALFKEPILQRLRHPKLLVKIEAKPPFCVRTPHEEKQEDGGKWLGWRHYLRLWVENSGTVRANNVEVFLWRVSKRMDDGSVQPVAEFTPMNLRWSYSDYNKPTIFLGGLSPGMGRFCDFAAISDPKCPTLAQANQSKTLLSLRLESLRPFPEWLGPGQYTFDLKLAADNSAPASHTIQLHLTGLWSDDPAVMLSHGLRFD